MSTFAIVPWSEQFNNDKMFDYNPPYNHDFANEPYIEMKGEFERLGHSVHTIDKYDDYKDVDFILFFSLDWNVHHKAVSLKMDNKMVYCTAEPPSVYSYNSYNGYRLLRRIFPYILTWNEKWVDNKSVFKRNIPYYLSDQRSGMRPFNEKKLLTCICGCKESDYPGELYSERRKAIEYFEKYHPEHFDFYGKGWNKEAHGCYGGPVESKNAIYHKYRYALCYENIEGLTGYITEKILDCFASGIVPVYAGASDIQKYIPQNCFIDLRAFANYSSLYDYLAGIKENEYNSYLENAGKLIELPLPDFFSGKKYAQYILDAISHDKSKFKSSKIAYKVFKYRYYKYFRNE